jgi:hypothetical protein
MKRWADLERLASVADIELRVLRHGSLVDAKKTPSLPTNGSMTTLNT